ncbi:MAG: class II aldolase/adducin family protein, partial [Thermoleophilaceae bacterium]|nr:class II aldolase/adducin family protein [Thermoleophilaceae bacterium]
MSLRAEVVAAAREMHRRGLVAGTAGNVSARSGDLVYITPSALPYDEMGQDDLVTLDLDGAVVAGWRKPSSERRVHVAVYAARPEVRAIVHTHSGYATAWSSLGEPLFTSALGDAVHSAEWAPPGSEEIAGAAVAALGPRPGVLLARHGVLGVGAAPAHALAICAAIEREARPAWLARGLDARALMAAASRPLVLGIGGGGDVVGALATAELCRLEHGARPVLGGTTWER